VGGYKEQGIVSSSFEARRTSNDSEEQSQPHGRRTVDFPEPVGPTTTVILFFDTLSNMVRSIRFERAGNGDADERRGSSSAPSTTVVDDRECIAGSQFIRLPGSDDGSWCRTGNVRSLGPREKEPLCSGLL